MGVSVPSLQNDSMIDMSVVISVEIPSFNNAVKKEAMV